MRPGVAGVYSACERTGWTWLMHCSKQLQCQTLIPLGSSGYEMAFHEKCPPLYT